MLCDRLSWSVSQLLIACVLLGLSWWLNMVHTVLKQITGVGRGLNIYLAKWFVSVLLVCNSEWFKIASGTDNRVQWRPVQSVTIGDLKITIVTMAAGCPKMALCASETTLAGKRTCAIGLKWLIDSMSGKWRSFCVVGDTAATLLWIDHLTASRYITCGGWYHDMTMLDLTHRWWLVRYKCYMCVLESEIK